MIDKTLINDSAIDIANKVKSFEEINNVLTEDSLPTTSDSVMPEQPSPVMEKALSSEFNSEEELHAKKVMAAALLIAKKQGVLPENEMGNVDGVGAATVADESVSRMKVAYKVATGDLDRYEATDKLIDHASARLLAVSDIVVARGVKFAINRIGNAVACLFPPALPVVMTIKAAQPYITEKAQKLVKTGIRKLSELAKPAAKKTIEWAKQTARSVSSKILKIFG